MKIAIQIHNKMRCGIWIEFWTTGEWKFDGYDKEFWTETDHGIALLFYNKFPYVSFATKWRGYVAPEGRDVFK